MSIKILNEGFEKLHENSLYEEKSYSSDLEKALENALYHLAMKQEMNIKKYEIAFQDAIESQFPEKSWWEVTDCNIFWDLVENKNPSLTIKHIIDKLKPEFKESLEEDTVKQNGKWVNKGKEGTHGKFNTKKAADAQRKAMFANGYKAEALKEDKEKVFTVRVYQHYPLVAAVVDDSVVDKNGEGKVLKRFTNWEDIDKFANDLVKNGYVNYQGYGETKGLKESSSDDKLVIYKALDKYRVTPKSNYNSRIQNARKIQKLDDFNSAEEIINYYVKNGWAKEDEFEVIDESKKITERNLTRAERHNRDMEKIFSTKRAQDKKFADFLRKNGYSEEQVDELQKKDKLSFEIAQKFTPNGGDSSEVLGKILKESDEEIEYEKKYYSKLRPDGSGEIDYWEVDAPKHPKDWGRGERNRVFLDKKEWQKRAFGIKENKNLKEAEAPAGYSPKKQGKAYKVFRVKNGKLYPPMVANPGGKDTPIGKWLIADEGEFAGLSKTGRPQVKSSQGGTLSYRPGWHLGDIPRASQFDRTNKETGEKEFPKDFVWAECSYTMDVDYQPESDEQGYMRIGKDGKPYRSDKYQHSLAGLPKLPKDGYYKYRTNPRPDTVPWVITGAIKVDRLLSDAEVNEILKKNGVEPIHRQGGDKTLAELGLRESLNRKSVKEDWWNNQSNYTVLDHEDEYPTNGQWFEFVYDFYNGRLGHATERNRGHYKARDINHALEKFWRNHQKASNGESGFILVSVKDESGKEYISEKLSNKRKLKESKKLTESFDDMEVFMNTWANYNEYGADGVLTPTGWMSIDEAIEYCEEYADYEPFINDTDNIPFDDINEYSNASSTLKELKELQESNVDEDIVEAIVEATGYDIKEAVEIAERGDYFFYPGVNNYTDLAYAVIDEIGGVGEALGDRVVNYIDEDQMRREYSWDIREIMRDSAEQEVDEAHEGEDEDSYDREQEIEDWMDEHEDEWLDMVINDELDAAERGEVDLSNYFDYEAFGRDLSFDGYTLTDKGAILVN